MTPKPSTCDWCHRSARIIHWLGIAQAWVCWSCFQGRPYDEFVAALATRDKEPQP